MDNMQQKITDPNLTVHRPDSSNFILSWTVASTNTLIWQETGQNALVLTKPRKARSVTR